MRKSQLSLYTPLLVVVLVQALIIAVAPSRSPQQVGVGEGALPGGAAPADGAGGGAGAGGPVPGASAPAAGTTATTGGSQAAGQAGGQAGGGSAPSTTGAGTTGTAAGSQDGGQAAAGGGDAGTRTQAQTIPQNGDTSHCKGDRQHDVVYHAPPCVPKWPQGRDNGGATYQGVTRDKITVLLFRENKNEQVSFLLEKEDLRATKEQDRAFMEAAQNFLNEHYEFYGRELELILFDAANCPETPPDVPACKNEALRAIKEHQPLAVIWPVPLYPEVFDVFVQNGVIALGGWHFNNDYFEGRRPYRYDVFMDGTRTAELLAEYYCKKMAGGNATHAGQVIHPSFPRGGQRDLQPRRVGITVPEPPATRLAAEHAAQLISECDRTEALVYPYVSDIERSQQQADAITQAMISDRITTVVMMSDPIAPIFRTRNQTKNNYYPELLLPGSGLLDYDKLGRLYDPPQMEHTFGPSHLQVPIDHSDSDASKIWRAGGESGEACGSCNLNGAYYIQLGALLQSAGPNLNPATVEQGALNLPPSGSWEETGGNPHIVLSAYGGGDYTAVSNIKEVYWDKSAQSRLDGRPGAYVAMYKGQRWQQGELPDKFEIPVPSN